MGGESNDDMALASMASYSQLVERPVGKQIHSIYRERLRMFIADGQYKRQNLTGKLYDARLDKPPNVKLHVWSAPDLSRPTFEEATKKENEYRKTHKGESL